MLFINLKKLVMKKVFLLLTLSVFVLGLNAQTYKNTETMKAPNNHAIIDYDASDVQQTAPYRGGTMIGWAPNIYGTMLSGVHQVMYNEDINTVVFIHRQDGLDDSGELGFDFSTDGGDTWTSDNHLSQTMGTTSAHCRYPSITIFNPDGNTDPASASVVATGPALSDDFGGWGWVFEIDAPIAAGSTANEFYGTVSGDNDDFHPYGIEMGPDGTAWSVSINYDVVAEAYIGDVFLSKAVWNGTDAMTWTNNVHTFTPNYNTSGGDKLFNGWDVAVDPNDPDHLYVVINCCEVGDPIDVASPHVWETTDGGEEWTQIASPDFTAEPFATALDEYIIYNEGEPMKPYIAEIDATVDANGALHIMSDTYSGAADWGYIYAAFTNNPEGPGEPTQHYIDFWWNGTEWDMIYIKSKECESATWGDVETYLHPQISRTGNGNQINYTWSQTYQDADSLNTSPNMWAYAWAIDGTTMEAPVNLTPEGDPAAGICFFPHVSPVSILNEDDGTVELPIVINMITFVGGSDVDPVEGLYLSDYTIPYYPFSSGVEHVRTSSDIIVYPNPVADKVYVSQGRTATVYNMLGAKVYEQTSQEGTLVIDMDSFSSGTYIFKVQTENGVITKKVIKK